MPALLGSVMMQNVTWFEPSRIYGPPLALHELYNESMGAAHSHPPHGHTPRFFSLFHIFDVAFTSLLA